MRAFCARADSFKPAAGANSIRRVKVLVVGSGGREHALAWKLAQSPRLTELHAAPGNPGIAGLGPCHPVHPEDAEGLLALAHALGVDLVVIGPEVPLVSGVADALRLGGVPVFGPSAAAARIEGSKRFAKEVMQAAGVPIAEALAVARPPCVVKADGLAGGKGVFVCHTQDELDAALRTVAGLGDDFVVEELLEGDELSVFAICDGVAALGLPPARDFKRAFDGDAGPNTGGMGAFAPVALGDLELAELVATVHEPVLRELARRDAPFIGLLYAGLMLTESGPKVLEFNCRFGDPETQAILPGIDGDLLGALAAAAAGDLGDATLGASEDASVTVVLAAHDYPAAGDVGSPITGIAEAEADGAIVFHAGTALRGAQLVTNGGRVLNVSATGSTLGEARSRAYAAAERIVFDGVRFRTDVALEAANGAPVG
jgi:phosphoribosylamine--glycine ligase